MSPARPPAGLPRSSAVTHPWPGRTRLRTGRQADALERDEGADGHRVIHIARRGPCTDCPCPRKEACGCWLRRRGLAADMQVCPRVRVHAELQPDSGSCPSYKQVVNVSRLERLRANGAPRARVHQRRVDAVAAEDVAAPRGAEALNRVQAHGAAQHLLQPLDDVPVLHEHLVQLRVRGLAALQLAPNPPALVLVPAAAPCLWAGLALALAFALARVAASAPATASSPVPVPTRASACSPTRAGRVTAAAGSPPLAVSASARSRAVTAAAALALEVAVKPAVAFAIARNVHGPAGIASSACTRPTAGTRRPFVITRGEVHNAGLRRRRRLWRRWCRCCWYSCRRRSRCLYRRCRCRFRCRRSHRCCCHTGDIGGHAATRSWRCISRAHRRRGRRCATVWKRHGQGACVIHLGHTTNWHNRPGGRGPRKGDTVAAITRRQAGWSRPA
mmetsp:Transcript_3475/g.9468  ORF Transcript_3475/g.9468 Transcript_3475/m.9468 type:complete len:446 (-) Transcript_3475:61-1398(-)